MGGEDVSTETESDFKKLAAMTVPAKRAAYSDRTAWLMALIAMIAYEPFDEESDDVLMAMAQELSGLSSADPETIKKRLMELALALASVGNQRKQQGNTVLKATLAVGGFRLVGEAPIHVPETDTQAMVLIREQTETELPIAVLVFRGTQQVKDWMTNIKGSPIPIVNPKAGQDPIGNMHEGFHTAFKSAEPEIRRRLEMDEVKSIPLYVCGHSLGGALAVVATWYLSSKQMAACYTFGAPRVGDHGLLGWFKTPIYRIVNAADPVPYVPPSGGAISVVKHGVRFLAAFIPWGGVLDKVVGFLVRQQNFRHYGDMKYLPFADTVNGGFPESFRIQPGISSLARLARYIRLFTVKSNDPNGASPNPDRVDRYHGMDRYRAKLRAVALNRNS